MSHQLSRVFLAFVVVLGAWFVRDQATVFFIERSPWQYEDETRTPSLLSNAVAGGVLLIGWWAVWRTAVHWTPVRMGLTVLAAGVAVAVGPLVVLCNESLFGGDIHSGNPWDLAGQCAACLWIGATAFLWRGGPTKHVARLPCPHCGYDLRGLHEARCPECGTEYTLDDLLVGRKTAELGAHGDIHGHVGED